MRTFSRVLGFACVVMFAHLSAVQAASENKQPTMEQALHDLQEAKRAADPMSLLEAAKKTLKHAKQNKHGSRLDAIALVDEAISMAKAGDMEKMRQKVDAAIANIHSGMSGAD